MIPHHALFCSSSNKRSELKVQICFCPSQLDPLTSDWRALPPMPSPRCLFSIGESANMLFAVAGKDLQTNESLDTVMCYDVESVVLFYLSLFRSLSERAMPLFSPFLAPFAKKKTKPPGDNNHQNLCQTPFNCCELLTMYRCELIFLIGPDCFKQLLKSCSLLMMCLSFACHKLRRVLTRRE